MLKFYISVCLFIATKYCISCDVGVELNKIADDFIKNNKQAGSFVFSPANYLLASSSIGILQGKNSIICSTGFIDKLRNYFSNALYQCNSLWLDDDCRIPQNNAPLQIYTCDLKNDNSVNDWLYNVDRITLQNPINKKTKTLSACYSRYYSNWMSAFKFDENLKEKFFTSPNSYTMIPYMKKTGFFDFCENANYSAVKIQFSKKNQCFLIILPKNNNTGEIEQNFADIFSEISHKTQPKFLTLSLPKIKIISEIDCAKIADKISHSPLISSEDSIKFGRKNKQTNNELDSFINITSFQTTEHLKNICKIKPILLTNSTDKQSSANFNANKPFIFAVIENNTILIIGRYNG